MNIIAITHNKFINKSLKKIVEEHDSLNSLLKKEDIKTHRGNSFENSGKEETTADSYQSVSHDSGQI